MFTLFSIVEENNDQIGEIELGQGRRMVFYVADPLILVSIGFGTSGQMRDELTIGPWSMTVNLIKKEILITMRVFEITILNLGLSAKINLASKEMSVRFRCVSFG